MDLFEKQAQLQSLFQTSPVAAAYAQRTPTGRRIAGRSVMEYLEVKKYDDVQSKALAERTRGERFAIDSAYVRARIARLREYTTLLADLRQIEHTKFKADPKLYGLAQWHLQQAV